MPIAAQEQDGTRISFEYLAKHRKLLREFCRFHVPSLMPFASDSDEYSVFGVTGKPAKFGHITSTSTCFSSLDLCPDELSHKKKSFFEGLGKKYAESAIEADPDKVWLSDAAAFVYCSCRGGCPGHS